MRRVAKAKRMEKKIKNRIGRDLFNDDLDIYPIGSCCPIDRKNIVRYSLRAIGVLPIDSAPQQLNPDCEPHQYDHAQ